ncbi:hypothetical protein D3C78_1382420 [compost metagenome]
MSFDIALEGLRIKSKAPNCNALIVSLVLSSLIPESIMTGTGFFFIISCKASKPFINGISKSKVTASGIHFVTASRASRPLLAVAITVNCESCSIISLMIFRINAESSTTRMR